VSRCVRRGRGAADDAAGLAISEKMTAQIRGLNQSVRNANDAISLIQTAEGGLIEVTNMLQRMRELSVQAATDTNTTADRDALNDEFVELRKEINRIAENTQWNGEDVLNKTHSTGSGLYKFQVGANATQNIELTIGNYSTTSATQATTTATVVTGTAASGPSAATPVAQKSTFTIGTGTTPALGDVITATVGDKSYTHTVVAGSTLASQTTVEIATAVLAGLGTITGVVGTAAAGVITFEASSPAYGSNSFNISAGAGGLLSGINSSSITTQAFANSAIGALDTALKTVSDGRAGMGATINRLEFAADNLSNVSMNASASRSRVLDTDYAQATTELARSQIIQQAATAMLAQANQQPASVLSLLQ
jgi:flagellin